MSRQKLSITRTLQYALTFQCHFICRFRIRAKADDEFKIAAALVAAQYLRLKHVCEKILRKSNENSDLRKLPHAIYSFRIISVLRHAN